MEFLHRLWTMRDITLPQFEPPPLEFNSEAEGANENLVRAPRTAGAMSPADELRNAVAELRRSLA